MNLFHKKYKQFINKIPYTATYQKILTKNAIAKIENSKTIQPFIHKNTIKLDFNYDLCNTLVIANILMNKLNKYEYEY